MFSMLKNLTKAVVATAMTPVDLMKDAATLGGELTDREESYTAERLRQAKKALDAALEPERE